MNYLKNLLFTLKYIVLIYIIQYIIVIVSSVIYLALGYNDLTSFISDQVSVILIIAYLIFIFLLLKKYRYKNKTLNKKMYYPLMYLGISIACLLNMLIYIITKTPSKEITVSLYISIISTGIIGPILEEVLFRYILLNDLKKFNSPKKAIIIATIIFALVHGSPIKILYAFILGLILNIIYDKYDNIKANIIVHMSANIIAIFLIEFNICILVLSLIGLIISTTLIKKYNKNGMK